MITREQYIEASGNAPNREESHRLHLEYFSQFLRPSAIDYVGKMIGKGRIECSQDRHFNDIELGSWDRLTMQNHIDTQKFSDADPSENRPKGRYPWSKSDNVCLAKAAAAQIRDAAQR